MGTKRFSFLLSLAAAGALFGAAPSAFAYYNLFAFWQNTAATQLAFSPASNPTLTTWSCTAETIKRESNVGGLSTEGTTIITLTGTNVSFYSDSNCLDPINTATIPPGLSSVVVYFSYSATGTQSITASSSPLTSVNQSSTVSANTYTWVGGASCDETWRTGACWSGGTAPGSSQTAIFDSTCTINCSPNLTGGAITIKGIYLHTGYSGTLTEVSGNAVTVTNLSIDAGSFVGSSDTLTITNLAMTGGSLTLSSGNTYINSTLNVSGGTFSANSGWVYFYKTSGPSSTYVNAPGISLNNVYILQQFSGPGVTITGGLSVAGNLDWDANYSGKLVAGTIYLQGNLTGTSDVTDSGTAVGGSIVLNGSGTQVIDGGDGTGVFPPLTIDSTGTVQLKNTVDTMGWDWQAGGVDASTYTNTLEVGNYASGMTLTPGVFTYPTVLYYIEGSTAPTTVSGTWYVTNLTCRSNYLSEPSNGGSIDITGSLAFENYGATLGTTVFNMVGTALQTITDETPADGGKLSNPLVINNTSGVQAATQLLSSTGATIEIASGYLDLNGQNISAHQLTVDSGATLMAQGGETVAITTLVNNTGSTVDYYGTGNYTGTQLNLGGIYYNLTFSGSGGQWKRTSSGNLYVLGNLTVESGSTLNLGSTLYLGGDLSNSGTISSSAAWLDLTAGLNHTISGNNSFNSLTMDNSTSGVPATLTFAAGSTLTITWSSDGAVNLQGGSGSVLSLVSGTPGTQWMLDLAYGNDTLGPYLSVTDSDYTGSGLVHSGADYTNGGNNTNWAFP